MNPNRFRWHSSVLIFVSRMGFICHPRSFKVIPRLFYSRQVKGMIEQLITKMQEQVGEGTCGQRWWIRKLVAVGSQIERFSLRCVQYLRWFISFFLPFSGWQKYVFGNLIFLQTNWVGFCSSRRPRRRPPRRAGVIPSCPATRPSVKRRPMLWSLCSRTLMRWLPQLPSWATRWSWERDDLGEVGRGVWTCWSGVRNLQVWPRISFKWILCQFQVLIIINFK